MNNKTINTEQGHWILANMGKKVLRPGGRELTMKLVNGLHLSHKDTVVEFAPGMGFTAELLCDKNPKSYTGIELNNEASQHLQEKFNSSNQKIINASAAKTGLEEGKVDKVIGEAMLTMQADHRKSEIIKEAYRILKPGGFYAIHELGLTPDDLDADIKKDIRQKLAKQMKVNARPLTKQEWFILLKKEGFRVKDAYASPMRLLEPERMIQDEGILGAFKIGMNLFTHPKMKKRVMAMRKVFRENKDHLTAYGIIVEK